MGCLHAHRRLPGRLDESEGDSMTHQTPFTITDADTGKPVLTVTVEKEIAVLRLFNLITGQPAVELRGLPGDHGGATMNLHRPDGTPGITLDAFKQGGCILVTAGEDTLFVEIRGHVEQGGSVEIAPVGTGESLK